MAGMSAEIELFDRLRKVEQQIGTHEAVCAERYKGLLDSSADMRSDISNVNKLLIKMGLMVLAGMATILMTIVFFPKR
jgi:hypothetical protein